MQWTLYIFGSGLAFFVAAVLLLLALVPSIAGAGYFRMRTLIALIGAIFLVLSAAPLPLWAYAILGVLLAAWLATLRIDGRRWSEIHTVISVAAFTTIVATVGEEIRYQFPAPLAPAGTRHIDLFGDSLAAGIGKQSNANWPELLAKEHDLWLVNHASPGAKVADALLKARETPLTGLVLLEIGGNDVLDGTSLAEFARNLDELLTEVSGGGRAVVMFELPLPPFHNGYGAVQRRLAARHGVHLVPKRVLMGVLAAQGTTIDSLHLNPAGHQQLADVVWRELEPAY